LVIDNESPPGAWKAELERAPWAYGQIKPPTVKEVLWTLRKLGLSVEASLQPRWPKRMRPRLKL
jgi:hypothetical protein